MTLCCAILARCGNLTSGKKGKGFRSLPDLPIDSNRPNIYFEQKQEFDHMYVFSWDWELKT